MGVKIANSGDLANSLQLSFSLRSGDSSRFVLSPSGIGELSTSHDDLSRFLSRAFRFSKINDRSSLVSEAGSVGLIGPALKISFLL